MLTNSFEADRGKVVEALGALAALLKIAHGNGTPDLHS